MIVVLRANMEAELSTSSPVNPAPDLSYIRLARKRVKV